MLKEKIISKASSLGFDLIGFTPYQLLDSEILKLEEWLNRSYQAGMQYMQTNVRKRLDVREILDSCESVISLGMNYYVDMDFENGKNCGKVSRYAWGRDYHLVIWEKLDELNSFIKNVEPLFESKSYCDTGPVMDKAWAVKAGLGWLGKHTNIINRKIGSWFFIANIFTNWKFNEYDKEITDYCGSCTACIDACPTDAIVEEYVVDSNKCISYLTIENKDDIPIQYSGKFENWIFGCDICQDVCPWNQKFALETPIQDFLKTSNKEICFEDIDEISERDFRNKFAQSPVLRSKLKGIRRNAEFLKSESKT